MKELKGLREPLKVSEIDFRVQSINKGGYATILAYKDARADMNRLDEVVGPLGWKREHLNNNANCIVSIWNEETKQWISKEDTGTESMTEKQKGLASDSFKRACFNWGIGRELYDYPLIKIQLKKDHEWSEVNGKPKQTYNLKLKDWTWFSQFTDGVLTYLGVKDTQKKVRFEWGVLDKSKIKVK